MNHKDQGDDKITSREWHREACEVIGGLSWIAEYANKMAQAGTDMPMADLHRGLATVTRRLIGDLNNCTMVALDAYKKSGVEEKLRLALNLLLIKRLAHKGILNAWDFSRRTYRPANGGQLSHGDLASEDQWKEEVWSSYEAVVETIGIVDSEFVAAPIQLLDATTKTQWLLSLSVFGQKISGRFNGYDLRPLREQKDEFELVWSIFETGLSGLEVSLKLGEHNLRQQASRVDDGENTNGPIAPKHLRWEKNLVEMRPLHWRLLNAVWSVPGRRLAIAEAINAAWGHGEEPSDKAVDNARRGVEDALLGSGAGTRCAISNGFIIIE